MARSKGRTGKPWRRIREIILQRNNTCWICGDIGADSLDHVIPLSQGGEPLNPNNLRPAHITCNSKRGTGLRGTNDGPSRDW